MCEKKCSRRYITFKVKACGDIHFINGRSLLIDENGVLIIYVDFGHHNESAAFRNWSYVYPVPVKAKGVNSCQH